VEIVLDHNLDGCCSSDRKSRI